jgi:diguanylate cyclase (GGDEF)-like protein
MSKRSIEPSSGAEVDPALDLAATVHDRRLAAADRQSAAEILASSYRDELTGALTRRTGRQMLTAEVERAHRTGVSLAVVFADVDGLKRANDTRGHAYGDSLLVAVAASLENGLRGYDLVVRYGGDEFVCALPGGTTDVAIRRVHHALLQLDRVIHGASFSAGFADLRAGEDVDDLVGRADLDLYGRRTLTRRTIGNAASTITLQPVGHRPPVLLSDVGCGQCGGRLPITTFVTTCDEHATRSADCPVCGETTVIRLAQPRSQ